MSNKVPQIRFNGYSDAWEERRLSDVANHRGGTAIEKYFDKDGVYKVISIGSYGLNSQYVDQNIRAISNEITDGRVVNSGELTMVLNDKTANGTIIGRSLLVEKDNEYVINQRTEIISPKENFDSNFAYTILNGPFREKVKRIVQGGTQIYVNYPAVSNLNLELPKIEEQQKIGSFFKQLDDTIALHQRKLDLLKEQKKGYLQKMFPKNGEKVPELRFAGFADDWEERKLEKVFDTITDYVANGSFESLRKNVNSSDINGFAYLVRLQDASNNWQGPWLYTDQHGYEFLKKSRLQPDDIIMANVGSVGKFFLVPKLDKPMTLAPNAVLIKSSENDQGFLYQMMLTPEMQYKIFEKTTPGAQSKINKTDFKMIETRLPNMDEQKKIGSFFKQLDDTIALHQRKLDLLKEQKKGFLQNMFV
ncbi:restriction endonuclease subunit S [Latilactobacillus curvatus]|uniref:restriction endonuclease subunit S n=1 Tax=Latilactobacillus curvatus TaxID=28038 RepID=UPI0020C79777|nr:restriction endonuclease subunit S [Latilactobacillus curvatus]MCP8863880.1 restriction endonuclease subunit S [Latilactobacillus curvatus]